MKLPMFKKKYIISIYMIETYECYATSEKEAEKIYDSGELKLLGRYCDDIEIYKD